jgi:hypothetical protein
VSEREPRWRERDLPDQGQRASFRKDHGIVRSKGHKGVEVVETVSARLEQSAGVADSVAHRVVVVF